MAITNIKKFLQEGGTQKDPKKVLSQFKEETGIGQTSSQQSSSSSQPTTSTTTTKRGGRNRSSSSQSSQQMSVDLPTVQAQQQQRNSLTNEQLARAKGFSGQVEVFSPSGQREETRYVVDNRQVGSVEYRTDKELVERNGVQTRQEVTREVPRVNQPSRLTFRNPQRERVVTLTRDGIREEETQFVATFPDDIGTVLEPVQIPQNTIMEQQKPSGFLEGLNYDLSKQRSFYQTKEARGNLNFPQQIKLFGVGVGTGIVGTALGVKSLVTKPKETILNIPSSTIGELKSLGTELRFSPSFATGKITGYYVGSKGIEYSGKIVPKSIDVIRTAKTIEVPKEVVIALEYFKGQTYPMIKKGQTAGELLKEFTPKEQYGVTSLRGFTASPKPFAKLTEAGAGSSELAGVYQAPKLSPQFLRITKGEKKVFSLNPLETLRPSATIIKPKAYELTPSIKGSQSKIAPLKPAKIFFEKEAELGKSYVPFIKTEKEAIIPSGTPLVLTDKRFYFKFEGRRIPIYEFEIGELNKKIPQKKVYTSEKVYSISSYKVGSKSYTSSADILKVVRSSSIKSSRSKPSYASYSRSSTPSFTYSSLKSYAQTPSAVKGVSYKSSAIGKNYGSVSLRYNKLPKPIPSGASFILSKTKPIISSYSFSLRNQRYFKEGSSKEGFSVFLRRFGKFKPIGTGLGLEQAFKLGKEKTRTSLGATFEVRGASARNIFGYKTKSTKKGIYYIEQPKYRLSTQPERKEIQYFKLMKGGRRK